MPGVSPRIVPQDLRQTESIAKPQEFAADRVATTWKPPPLPRRQGAVRAGYSYLRRMFTLKGHSGRIFRSGILFARSSRADRAPETVFDSPLQESIALLRGLASQMEKARQLDEAQTVRRVMQLLYAPELQGARSLKELMAAGDVQVDQDLIDWLVEMEWLPEGARASPSNLADESASSGRPPPISHALSTQSDGSVSMKELMTAASMPSTPPNARASCRSLYSCTSIEEERSSGAGGVRAAGATEQQLGSSNRSDRQSTTVWSNAALPRVVAGILPANETAVLHMLESNMGDWEFDCLRLHELTGGHALSALGWSLFRRWVASLPALLSPLHCLSCGAAGGNSNSCSTQRVMRCRSS